MIVIILILMILTSNSCNETNDLKVAYFNDEPIYTYEVEAFLEMKISLLKIYNKNLEDVQTVSSHGDKITEIEYLNYLNYCQLEHSRNEIEKYLNFSEEEKTIDYFISLVRKVHFIKEFGDSESINKINEYNKSQILEYPDKLYCGNEIVGVINQIAKNYNLSFDECLDEVYLKVALDLNLQNYMPQIFISNDYEGQIFEDVDSDTFKKLGGLNDSDVDLQDMWTTTENYYKFLEDMSSQFYFYLKNRALEEVTFY